MSQFFQLVIFVTADMIHNYFYMHKLILHRNSCYGCRVELQWIWCLYRLQIEISQT